MATESKGCCVPCDQGEHADDGTGQACPCCGVYVPAMTQAELDAAVSDVDVLGFRDN